ncbi:MAG: succinylglutamate desuccinylase/aspartoacylase family protein [Burkholderiaceae bacterium]
MKTVHHALTQGTPGVAIELQSLHYGTPGAGPKATLQAALHADEIPGLLVAHHLRARLAALEAQGRIVGEIVLVPVANPIGLAQRVLGAVEGRFELASGENFNRHYADVFDAVARRVEGSLGADAQANVALIRAALREAAAALPARSTLESLRRTLLGLSIDADIVLDLHCDSEAVLHLYTETSVWRQVEPLARFLGCEAALLAEVSGDHPFDEACSTIWPRLAARFGAATPIPSACVAVTVELRGEADVAHDLAERDAQAIVDYLAWQGLVTGAPAALPPARCEATPLAGSIPVNAPHAGVVAYLREPGARVVAGERLADLIEPMTGLVTPLVSPIDGVFYARETRRCVPAGAGVLRVAGREALRSGNLLTA